MSYLGTPSSRRKREEEYQFYPKACKRAGAALRRQAIERTLRETLFPHEVWGIEGRTAEFSTGMNKGATLSVRNLSDEAKVRLSLLRAVDFGGQSLRAIT